MHMFGNGKAPPQNSCEKVTLVLYANSHSWLMHAASVNGVTKVLKA